MGSAAPTEPRSSCADERGYASCHPRGIAWDAGSRQDEDTEPVLERGGLWGVYRFKQGFGGRLVRYSQSYDYVCSPLLYWLGTKLHSWVQRLTG